MRSKTNNDFKHLQRNLKNVFYYIPTFTSDCIAAAVRIAAGLYFSSGPGLPPTKTCFVCIYLG